MTFIKIYHPLPKHSGYIAGTGAGIVSIAGQAVQRQIYLYQSQDALLQPTLVDMQAQQLELWQSWQT